MNILKIVWVVMMFIESLHANCSYDSITQNEIYSDLYKYKINSDSGSCLNYANIILPKCEILVKKSIIDSVLFPKEYFLKCWPFRYLKNFSISNVNYLTNGKNGDDWIIGWWEKNGNYIQYVDGRTLTILIKIKNNLSLDMKLEDIFGQIYSQLKDIVSLNAMLVSPESNIKIEHKNEKYIDGYFVNTINGFDKYKRDYFWTNGKYIILDIEKINIPYRSFKHSEIYLYNEIVNGIPREDKRSFTRFRKNENIDLNAEMFKIFPWMVDSIKYYKENQTELYGKTPIYILENKK